MAHRNGVAVASIALLFLTACASSKVSEQQSTPAAETVARPNHVIVYDFAGTPDDLPSDSVIAKLYQERSVPQTAQDIELGRRLGQLVSTKLVEKLTKAGIAAEAVETAPVPMDGDAVIRGEFVTVDEGHRLKRVLIGFGAGAAQLETLVEAYEITPSGLRPLGSAKVMAEGGQLPGVLVPLGIGGAAGSLVVSAAVAAASSAMKESGPETINAAAERTADEIAKLLISAYQKRGWL